MSDTPQQERKNPVDEYSGLHERGRPSDNLPLQLTSFVGRGREVSEVESLLAGNRLLTLTGPGGSGKTRLAMEVAVGVAERFEGGAWLVELAPLSDPELVPRTVASVLGVQEQPGAMLLDSLSVRLASRETLLVLDNCEHLVGACAALAGTLVRSCPQLRILATSRETLGVAGEALFAVPPLSLPDPRHLTDLENLPHYEATRLFVDRAKAVRPGFEITRQNAMAVAQVCYRLDGMPLAIELAAAMVRVLSVEQISERLEESFSLLSGGGRTAMSHHRTLRATMDWSYGLLPEEERKLLRQLSVFAGGWTLEMAEEVCAGNNPEPGEVLDVLSSLVDKSLVLMSEQDGEARYRLLETVRQYGREKLEEAGEEDEASRHHALYFLTLAEEAEPHLRGREQLAWLERLETEHDNLRAAMRWLLREGEVEPAVRLAWALWFFWHVHGDQSEGYRYTEEALKKGEDLPAAVRARLLCTSGLMSHGLGNVERTKQLWEESVTLFRQTEDAFGLAIALGGVGITTMQRGDMERASALFEETLKVYRGIGNEWGVGAVLSYMGLIPLSRGDYPRASRYFEQALAHAREVGDRLICSISLHNLALASRAQGDHERATRLYCQALELSVEMGDKADSAYCLEGLAELISTRENPERAVRLFGASEAFLEAAGTPRHAHTRDRALYEHAVETLRSRLGEEPFEAAWAVGRAMTPEQAVEYALKPSAMPVEPAPPSAYPADLSAREVEVLKLVASGMTNAQIARELFISPRTVNAHMGSVYQKIGSSTRAQAARFASEHDLL